MSFFEDLFEVFEGRRRRGHHGGQNYDHHSHHNKHSYDNHHDHCEVEDYQTYPNTYEGRERLFCPQCSAQVQPDAKFCHSCGAHMSTNKNCPRCGSGIQPNSAFCPNCGRKVNSTGIQRSE